MLQYQIDEIDKANVQPDEDERLRQERVQTQQRRKNLRSIFTSGSKLVGEEEQIGAYTLLGQSTGNTSFHRWTLLHANVG